MLKRLLMRANHLVRLTVFRRRAFIRAVFGVEPVAAAEVQSYCEWATVLMRLVLRRYLQPRQALLDLGTGAHAVLAIYAKKYCPSAAVTATEVLQERVEWARRTIVRNEVDVECVQADLFDGIARSFDLVLLTPPAIPSADLLALGYKPQPQEGKTRLCWSGDGGIDGLDVIGPFLEELPAHLSLHGKAILCVNPSHCHPSKIAQLSGQAGLRIERVHRLPGIMNAYVLARPGTEREAA